MPEQLVFIDESSCDRRTSYHGWAWAIIGQRALWKAFFVRGKRDWFHLQFSSVLPAMSLDGILYVRIVKGSFNYDSFGEFIDGLLDQMNPFPGPNFVIVMDNCRILEDLTFFTFLLLLIVAINRKESKLLPKWLQAQLSIYFSFPPALVPTLMASMCSTTLMACIYINAYLLESLICLNSDHSCRGHVRLPALWIECPLRWLLSCFIDNALRIAYENVIFNLLSDTKLHSSAIIVMVCWRGDILK